MNKWIAWLDSRSPSLLVAANVVAGIVSGFFYFVWGGPGIPIGARVLLVYSLISAALFSDFPRGMKRYWAFLLAWVSVLAGIGIVFAVHWLVWGGKGF